jgi:hypothetical protein
VRALCRQFWLPLFYICFVIVACMWSEAFAFPSPRLVNVAIFSLPAPTVHICVENLAVHIKVREFRFSDLKRPHVSDVYCRRVDVSFVKNLASRGGCRGGVYWKGVICWRVYTKRTHGLPINLYSHFICGAFPEVFCYDEYLVLINISLNWQGIWRFPREIRNMRKIEDDIIYPNICPGLTFGGILRDLDRSCSVIGLFPGGLRRCNGGSYCLLAVNYGSPSCSPKQSGEEPQSSGDKNKSAGKPSGPPVWTRVPLALFLGLGANGAMIIGLLSERRMWRWLLCGAGVMMFISGMGLMLALGIPATWSWLV